MARTERQPRAAIARPRRKRELQDGLNQYFYHPLAWQLARALSATPITPNMVSVLGALLVVGAGIAYAQPWYPASAALGMTLHMGWHVVDGADGDLARITGKASPIGEMVDGICDYASHVILYFILGWLLHFQIGWLWANVAMWAAGISHIVQSSHVEAQRRSYQYWVYDVPWLKTTHAAAGAPTRRGGLGGLAALYLRVANGATPVADRIDAAVVAAEGNAAGRDEIRNAVRAEWGPLLTLYKFLGPNPRAIVLGLSMFAGSPLYYFVYQAVVLNILLVMSVRMHNAATRRVAARIGI